MHFFLDSTVFQNGKDVFLNNRLSREFLNICRQQNFSIYISSVVIDEIRRQFSIFIKSQIKNINLGIGAMNTLPNVHNISVNLPQYEDVMRSFDSYFERLREEGLLHIVQFSNDFLPELIHKSIYRIKPFTDSKQEFRDAVIWFSYAKLAEDQQLENCFFISGNTTDYLDRQGQIHEELAEKSDRFTFFRDVYSLLNTSYMDPFKATNALLESLKEQEWDSETILNFLKEDVSKSYILKHLTDDIDGSLREELWSSMYYSNRTISNLDLVNICGASIRGIDFINNEFVVSGNFEAKIHFVSELKTEDLDLRDPQLGHEELMIWFDAIYNPDSHTFQRLEISSYIEAHDYWMGVHSVGQDRF
ncbi:PIN domain-containing protein [Sporosarcina sp. ACRSL]|uniref:PIN domain-containing protein n=1 Tax=Sporosarcina sp. ACRSL TaxID=2918215 RepID=UPI001EF54B91|nr:PIN domain-containing protein [Sporosarcina sp. ACRSL]MCG7346099.1 PIN domain-containing protein [Sporosarcina sp. ACRSL]